MTYAQRAEQLDRLKAENHISVKAARREGRTGKHEAYLEEMRVRPHWKTKKQKPSRAQ